ncbi:hypothetical protein E2C01_030094 [Portunus trituberculatus]|uniref:Uncharacterized protein n=1 Tax=Portunus trituberculatus TaxID=210409 RepID=A0A5B7ETR7_PORTR|nr:hypothetical protein [Portunus trituberculatus]
MGPSCSADASCRLAKRDDAAECSTSLSPLIVSSSTSFSSLLPYSAVVTLWSGPSSWSLSSPSLRSCKPPPVYIQSSTSHPCSEFYRSSSVQIHSMFNYSNSKTKIHWLSKARQVVQDSLGAGVQLVFNLLQQSLQLLCLLREGVFLSHEREQLRLELRVKPSDHQLHGVSYLPDSLILRRPYRLHIPLLGTKRQ